MQKSRTPKTRLFITTMIVVMLCSVTGCIFLVKVRSVSWPGIYVREEMPLWYFGKVKFEMIYFERGEDGTEFSVRMPDGRILTSDQLAPEALAPYVTPFDQLTDRPHPSWAEWSIIEYDSGQVRVYFENGKATRVNAVNSRSRRRGQCVPEIGNRDGTQAFPLPITEDELIKLFGEPTVARTYLFNT